MNQEEWRVGDIVTRDGTDEHEIIDIDQGMVTVRCVKAPIDPWATVGEVEDNLASRYNFVCVACAVPFLRTIRDRPDEDGPRLVYADWLAERGDTDAAFEQREIVARRAVLRSPDDDGLRLRYAEVCEDHGRKERAEFVRVQLAIAACQHEQSNVRDRNGAPVLAEFTCKHCGLGSKLNKREQELLAASAGWCPAVLTGLICENLSTMMRQDMGSFTFRRGFIHAITCSWSRWELDEDAILKHEPVREVRLTTYPSMDEFSALCQKHRYAYSVLSDSALKPGGDCKPPPD